MPSNTPTTTAAATSADKYKAPAEMPTDAGHGSPIIPSGAAQEQQQQQQDAGVRAARNPLRGSQQPSQEAEEGIVSSSSGSGKMPPTHVVATSPRHPQLTDGGGDDHHQTDGRLPPPMISDERTPDQPALQRFAEFGSLTQHPAAAGGGPGESPGNASRATAAPLPPSHGATPVLLRHEHSHDASSGHLAAMNASRTTAVPAPGSGTDQLHHFDLNTPDAMGGSPKTAPRRHDSMAVAAIATASPVNPFASMPDEHDPHAMTSSVTDLPSAGLATFDAADADAPAAPWAEPTFAAAAQHAPSSAPADQHHHEEEGSASAATGDADLFDDVDAILQDGKGAGARANASASGSAASGGDSSVDVSSSAGGSTGSSLGSPSSEGTSNAAAAFFAKKHKARFGGAASMMSGTDATGFAGFEDPLARPFLCDLAYKCMHPSSTSDLDFRPYHCQAALMFADISGYSALGQLPAHAVAQAVNGYFERMLDVVQRFGGSVLSFAGDAVVVLFPAIASGGAASGAAMPVTASAAMGSISGLNGVTAAGSGIDLQHGSAVVADSASIDGGAMSSVVEDNNSNTPPGSQTPSAVAAAATAMMEKGALYEAGSNTLEGACLCALGCAQALQQECGEHVVVGVAKPLRLHIGVSAGEFEMRVLRPTAAHDDAASPEAFTFASGSVMRDIEAAVDTAATGEVVCTRAALDGTGMRDAISHVTKPCRDGDGDCVPGDLLEVRGVPPEDCPDPRYSMAVNLYRRVHQELKEVVPPHAVAGKLAPPTILHRLRAGIRREELAEMRNLVVLFIGMDNDDELTEVDVSTWFTEVFDVLSSASCGILQILDDDKGVHIVAAMNVYEAEDGAADSALAVTRALVEHQCGVKIGVAAGPCFCGLIGSESDYRWDVTGATCIRACRLMQFASRSANVSVALDQSVVRQLNDASQARLLKKAVLLKGSPAPVRVYTNSDIVRGRGTISCIAKINEFSLQTRAAARNDVIRTVVSPAPEVGRNHRVPAVAAAIVAGTPGSGKKTVVLSAVDGTPFVPILYRASKRAPAGDVARALASWFSFHPNAKLREMAERTAAACEKGYSTQSAKLASKLIAATVEAGLHTALIVDRAEIVDEPSVHIAAATIAWAFKQQTASSSAQGSPNGVAVAPSTRHPSNPASGYFSSVSGSSANLSPGGSVRVGKKPPPGRFLWMFTLTPRSGGFSVASLTSALQTRCAEHQQARAVPCALTLPKATPEDYNGIMNAFGFWSLPHNDRQWLTEVTGGDPGMFREFVSLVPGSWTERWLRWREELDAAAPGRVTDVAAELAKIGFASTRYFIGGVGGPQQQQQQPELNGSTSATSPAGVRSPAAVSPSHRVASATSPGLMVLPSIATVSSQPVSRRESNHVLTSAGSVASSSESGTATTTTTTDVCTLPRSAVYGRAYDQLQMPRPDDVEIDVLADGTWSMSEAGRKRGLVMLGHIATTFVARRGSFFDALSPYQQMLLKIIAALTHAAPPARCLQGVLLQLTRTFLQVKTSALEPALHAAKELLMLETADGVDAALSAVGDYEPGVTTSMSKQERATRIAALAARCPPLTPQSLAHGALGDAASVAPKVSSPNTEANAVGSSSRAPPSVKLAPEVDALARSEAVSEAGAATPGQQQQPPPPPPAQLFWAFRSPAQRHAVAGLLTPAQVRTVCKLAARKMIMDAGEAVSVPFAELLDVIVLLHRSGDRKRRDDALVAVWAHVHQLLTSQQLFAPSAAPAPTSVVSADGDAGLRDDADAAVAIAVLQEQESLLALLAEITGVDMPSLLAKRAKHDAAKRKQMDGRRAPRRGTKAAATADADAGEPVSDVDDDVPTPPPVRTSSSVAANADDDARMLTTPAMPSMAPRRRRAPTVEFHGPSMPTVVERCKNAEPPLILGPIGAAASCLTRVIAYRAAALSPQFQSDRPEPPMVPREHLQALLDVFERVVPRTTDEAHTVQFTAAEEAAVLESLYATATDYATAVRQSELLLEYVERALRPRARRALAFAHQLCSFDVVVPRASGRLAQAEQARLLDQTQPTSLAGAAAATVTTSLDEDDADAMSDLGALRRGFKAVAGLKDDTDDTVAIEATRDALMALAVCNWSAPAGHARMTPAGLREALQQQWLEPLDLKAIVAMYMMDVAVRRKWRISYLVDAECEVVA